jgi:hypothetical protein
MKTFEFDIIYNGLVLSDRQKAEVRELGINCTLVAERDACRLRCNNMAVTRRHAIDHILSILRRRTSLPVSGYLVSYSCGA